jgi:hypothetical protein
VKSSLCIGHIGGMSVKVLTSAVDENKRIDLHSGHFTLEKDLGTHRTGGWVLPESILML